MKLQHGRLSAVLGVPHQLELRAQAISSNTASLPSANTSPGLSPRFSLQDQPWLNSAQEDVTCWAKWVARNEIARIWLGFHPATLAPSPFLEGLELNKGDTFDLKESVPSSRPMVARVGPRQSGLLQGRVSQQGKPIPRRDCCKSSGQ